VTERTIGVALSIPEPYGSELQAHRDSFGDPLASSIPTHITLLPPTPVPHGDMHQVEEHLRKVADAERSFEIHLRGTGTFFPVSPVVFVSVAMGISACERLEAAVRSGPLSRETRFPYHPHVTIAHHLPKETLERAFEQLSTYDARFQVWGFSLYEHGADGVWRPQRDFPFGRSHPGVHASTV
jgi:2'-5' RNA ligase